MVVVITTERYADVKVVSLEVFDCTLFIIARNIHRALKIDTTDTHAHAHSHAHAYAHHTRLHTTPTPPTPTHTPTHTQTIEPTHIVKSSYTVLSSTRKHSIKPRTLNNTLN